MKEFKTFTSFSVGDLDEAKAFYRERLELDEISLEEQGVLMFHTGGETRFMVYKKEEHVPADFTVLNFAVEDLGSVVNQLKGNGVTMEKLEHTNEEGIAEMGSGKAAWTRDPAGNWIGFFEQDF
jgi:catechol 2,3-dioxygenase-like lactoylglutathione lyase family enzyme